MITITNHRLLRLLGFEPVSPRAAVGMSWLSWLRVVQRRPLTSDNSA